MTNDERANRQRAIVDRIRRVSDESMALAEQALGPRSTDATYLLAWGVLRLATERPELWDAMAQLVQVRMLVDATERADDPQRIAGSAEDRDEDPDEALVARCRDVAAAIANGDYDVAEALYNAIVEARS